jgi:predicted PurR-regulated permease PerM
MDKKLFRSILWIITYTVLLALFILHFDEARGWVSALLAVLRPLFIGFAIAFVLHRPTQFFYTHYHRAFARSKFSKLARPLAVGTAYLVLLLLLFTFFSILLPKLSESIQLFVASMGDYMKNAQGWVNWLLKRLNMETLNLSSFSDIVKSGLTAVGNTLSTALPQILAFTGNLISIVVTAFLSIIFSIYLLSGRETLLSQCRRVLRAYVPKHLADAISDVTALTADTFTAFVSGQLLEACILGSLCALGVLFIQPDYAPLIGMIIGVSALVPIVGALVGGAAAALLLVMVNPLKTLIFIVFLLALQQFEGNVIYPRVVGGSLGLPALWVLSAVTVGGGLFGFVGVLVSVPVASVLYTLLRQDVHRRLDV